LSRYDVVSLFDFSGIACRPWAEAGYKCVALDIQHDIPTIHTRDEKNLHYRYADLKALNGLAGWCSKPIIVMAWPPCTHLAISGARWFKGKGLRALAEGIELVAIASELCESTDAPYLIENPVGTLSTYWRQPDYQFHPCDYAMYSDDPMEDAYTKKTWLWTGNGFVMPEKDAIVPVLGSKTHNYSQSKERQNMRSKTPLGFAVAVYEANKP